MWIINYAKAAQMLRTILVGCNKGKDAADPNKAKNGSEKESTTVPVTNYVTGHGLKYYSQVRQKKYSNYLTDRKRS